MTSWIPERYAKKGKHIKLKGVDGWLVVEVGSTRAPEDQVVERERDYLHQRKASDI